MGTINKMKKLIVVAVFLVVALAAALPAEALAGIRLTFDKDVPDNVMITIRRGITEAERFYKDNFGITIKKDLEIAVTNDKDSFAKALLRLGCDKTLEQAKKHAAKSGGSSCPGGGGIVIPRWKDVGTMFFVAIHELTHKYQFQESPGDRGGDIWWLVEGGATATAAYVADKCGVESLPDSYKEYLGHLKGKRHPLLKDLQTIKGHHRLQGEYPQCVYPTETLAALELARRKGAKSLYQYFLNLKKNKDSAKVFEMTFGIKLDRFEKEFENWLTQQLPAKK